MPNTTHKPVFSNTKSRRDLFNQLVASLGDQPITSLSTLLIATGCVENCKSSSPAEKLNAKGYK